MKRLVIAFLLLLIFLSLGVSFIVFSGFHLPQKQNRLIVSPISQSTFSSNTLWNLVNEYRFSKNLPPFIKSQILCDLANKRLQEIKIDWSHNGFWQHTNDFYYQKLGENLARYSNQEQVVLNSWLNSPTHRANLDYPYKYSCIETENFYVVQIFANF